MNFIKSNIGQTLVELLITIGLAAILTPALLAGLSTSRTGRVQQEQRLVAINYLREAQDALRIIDENDWNNLTNGTYHAVVSATTWTLAPGSEAIGDFTRQIEISNVQRDINGDIVISGGAVDPSTKQVTISVSWINPNPSSVENISYLTRHKNLLEAETTVTEFTAGVLDGAAISQTTGTGITDDGQVQLGAGGGAGGGDWCQPDKSVLKTSDLSGQGVAQSLTATSTATQNIAYTTTGGNASGNAVDGLTISFASPPAVLNPSFNNEAKAYGIFVGGDTTYVYFNENRPPNYTVRIVNSNNLTPVGYYNSSGGGTGTSIYVLGNTGFTTVGNRLYSFDVTLKTGSRPELDFVTLAGNGKRVFVVGTKAYVATDSTTSQLQIVDITNPSNINIVNSINLGNSLAGVDVYVDSTQTYAYVATNYAVGKYNFFVINAATGEMVGRYSTNGMNPKAVTVVPRNRAIIAGSGTGNLYHVVDTSTLVNYDGINPINLSNCGSMTPSGVSSINAVASLMQPDGKVFSYIVTNNTSAEFQIILGGPGSGQFASGGVYTSAPFELSEASTFNHFSATVSQPAQTTIGIQVSSARKVGGSCDLASYVYIGPDGTTGSYFNPTGNIISGQIPYSGPLNYANPGECFRYKVSLFSNDSTLTPVLYDFSINYSP